MEEKFLLERAYLNIGPGPLAGICNIRRLSMVMARGRVIDTDSLPELYEELELYGQAIEHYRESMKWRDTEDTKGPQKIVQRIAELQRR